MPYRDLFEMMENSKKTGITCKEFIKIKYPDTYEEIIDAHCPSYYDLADDLDCCEYEPNSVCDTCWDRKVTNEEKLQKIISHNSNKEGKTWAERIDENLAKANGTTVVNYPNLLRDTKKIVDHINDDMVKNAEKIKQEYKELYGSEKCIKDSGERREFETGAVRDIQEGKGRCDLMPLDVITHAMKDAVIGYIANFQNGGDIYELQECLHSFVMINYGSFEEGFLEVAKHFEAGAVKYGENNWQKGIPVHCYIDSAVRHYLKFLRGDDDEPHDRAFVWNIMCCIWTCVHKPELNDFCEVKADE